VEESKEEAPEEEDAPGKAEAQKPEPELVEEAAKDDKNKKGKEHKQQPASKPVPGSWASLVASGGSAPSTPSRKPVQQSEKVEQVTESTKAPAASGEKDKNESKENQESTADSAAAATTEPKTTGTSGKQSQPQQQRNRRDPDNTLVIKNLGDNVKEQDIINIFKPFAVQTNAKIVGTNLNHHRGLAFVDYDSVAPVNAALKKHAETPLQWNGKVLEIDQKSQEQRGRRNNNANNGFRNSGGGRDQYKRGGDRGGRRTGNKGAGRGGGGAGR
jgi:RNA recognition motif-containing protein